MTEPTIALALGAGGARGLAHIHALAALDELGLKPVALAGTSIGSIMAAAYASGMRAAEIETFAKDRFRIGTDLLSDIWRLRPGSFAEFMKAGGPRLGELNVEKIVDVFLPAAIPATFEQLAIPLTAVATDYYAHSPAVFSAGPLKPALAASAAVPAVFNSVIVDGTVYVDGGITNPVPFDQLAGKADIVIGIDVAGGPEGTPGKRPSKIDVLYASSQLMQRSIAKAMAQNYQVDIFLRPDVGRFRVLDFGKSIAILKHTRPFRDELKSAIEAAITAHQAA
ncbi:patatin-like phospholipase family protein [Pseudahrensia aquimaris]|uniref:Patatin-like phospholipase family protein n=1 Tax=Pseudahrensia aquimaris TaxID=744461 RepID=A0ABW3FEP7_9HYPH